VSPNQIVAVSFSTVTRQQNPVGTQHIPVNALSLQAVFSLVGFRLGGSGYTVQAKMAHADQRESWFLQTGRVGAMFREPLLNPKACESSITTLPLNTVVKHLFGATPRGD
jgi:hypothetical protein